MAASVLALFQNIALILALTTLQHLVLARLQPGASQLPAPLGGVLFGAMALLSMYMPINIVPGIWIDARVILVTLAGLFGGPVAVGIAVTPVLIYRILLGGDGVLGGSAAVLLGGLLGILAWRRWRHRLDRLTLQELLGFGLLLAVITLCCTGLLPPQQLLPSLRNLAAPVLLVYPLGTLLLGWLLVQDHQRRSGNQVLSASEQRFRAVFHANPAPHMLTRASDGMILDVNPALTNFFGYPRDTLIGRHTPEVNIWRNWDRGRLLEEIRRDGHLSERPIQAYTAGGELRELLLAIEPLQLDGQDCLLSVMMDVSALRAAERALERSEGMLTELVQSISAVLWEGDLQTTTCSFINDQVVQLLGYPKERWLSVPGFWVDRIYPADRSSVLAQRQRGVETLEDHESEYRMVAADGRLVWVRDLVTVIHERRRPVRLRGVMLDISARKLAEEAKRASEDRLRVIFERAAIGIALVDLGGRIVEANPALQQMLGRSAEELRAMTFLDVTYSEDIDDDLALFQGLIAGEGEFYQLTKRFLHSSGQIVWGNLRVSLTRDPQGVPQFTIGMVEDITEKRRIEQQYLQAQKLDSIGQMAGGIAHDFNNLLTVVLGNTALILDETTPEQPIHADLIQIRDAAERAATLTRQLLAFSRRQILHPIALNLNLVVRDMGALLRRLVGVDITLTTRLDPQLGTVLADPAQIEQVLLNLAINARDAMPDGGALLIETLNVTSDPDTGLADGQVPSGSYVVLAVSDTGCGMEPAVQARIFEPFFTTKPPGKGSGLGLATVYGIVKQSGGTIAVYSEPGRGSRFQIYLPHTTAVTDPVPSAPPLRPPNGSSTVLLVEDEPGVCDLAERVLTSHGYRVLRAAQGDAALQVAETHAGVIDLLLTDVIMPGGLSGLQLAERLRARYPALRVLYMSGHTDRALGQHIALEAPLRLLQKPFTPDILLQTVWTALSDS
jgi:PAS domain S-box-containing protein